VVRLVLLFPDEQLDFEHSRLIRQNYHWLTESLDPDSGLLSLLFQKEIINSREYEQIRVSCDRFKKNETLLSIISRKTPADFKEFQKALIETLQSEIVDKLTFGRPRFRIKRISHSNHLHLIYLHMHACVYVCIYECLFVGMQCMYVCINEYSNT